MTANNKDEDYIEAIRRVSGVSLNANTGNTIIFIFSVILILK